MSRGRIERHRAREREIGRKGERSRRKLEEKGGEIGNEFRPRPDAAEAEAVAV